jgi:hypothetical protein
MGRLRWRIPGVRGLYDRRTTLDCFWRAAGPPNSAAGTFVVDAEGIVTAGVWTTVA